MDWCFEYLNKFVVKKYGYGGKFIVDGLFKDEDYVESIFVVMDEYDFNYVDFVEEMVDKEVGIFVIKVVKFVVIGVGVVYLVF